MEDQQRNGGALSTCNRFDLQVAIALNNMAIIMMERECYQQAYETLADAVATVKIPLFQCNSKKQPVKSFLNEANHRLSHPEVSAATRNHGSLFVSVKVVSQQEASSKLSTHAASWMALAKLASFSQYSNLRSSSNNTASEMSLIRIDESEDLDLAGCREIATTILLYNFGVANLLPSLHKPAKLKSSAAGAACRRKQGQAGIRLLKLTKNLLSRQLAIFEKKHADERDPFLLAQLLFVTKVVLETQISTWRILSCCGSRGSSSRSTSCESEVQSCATALAAVRCMARRLEEDMRWVQVSTTSFNPAPAA